MASRAVFTSITMLRVCSSPAAQLNNSLSARRSQNNFPRRDDLLVSAFRAVFTCTAVMSEFRVCLAFA